MNAPFPTILVIDDDPSVRISLVAYLEDEGFEVMSADSGERGLEIIAKTPPQLAIVDMRLPGIDGNEVIVRAHAANPDIKFIVLTGSYDYVIPSAIEDAGLTPDNVMQKPVADMDDIVQTILRIVKG